MVEKATAGQLMVKPLQFVEEATEGTTPTSSPTFASVGFVDGLSFKINGNYVEVGQVAAEDLIALIQGNAVYEFQVKLHVTSSTYLKYALNAYNPGTPTGTISASVSHLFSIYLNGTENFILMKGCRAKDVTISVDIGKPLDITINWVAMSIIQPITTANAGLTTPTFATVTATGAIWDWTSGGTTPVSWNSTAINCKKISLTVNRNTKPEYTLGNVDPYGSLSHKRIGTGDLTVLWTTSTGSALETDFRSKTSRTLAWVLKSATATLTITGTTLKDRTIDLGADDSEATIEQWSFGCTSLTVT